jgi:hypothetical protein
MFILLSNTILFADNYSLQYKKEIAQYKKTTIAMKKAITLLKKRERSYTSLVRNLARLHKIIVEKLHT